MIEKAKRRKIFIFLIIVHKNIFLSCAHVPHSRFSVFRCAHEAKKICARPSKNVHFAQKKPGNINFKIS